MDAHSDAPPLATYSAWDPVVRWFHWVNLACVLGLIAVGVAILNDKALGVGNDGKILLKTVHVVIGYVFAANLAVRLIWAFAGGAHARWSSILPVGRGYPAELRNYLADLRADRPRQYVGHNPVGRIAITVLLALLFTQAVTGLILAGTDLFFPPLGAWIAEAVAAPGVDPATLVPYAPAMYDPEAHAAMRLWRGPIVAVHEAGFYVLLGVAALHILGVVVTEVRERGNLVSAMFSGKKILKGPPVDRR